MTLYFQIFPGEGMPDLIDPDAWTPLINCTDRQTGVLMVAQHWLTERYGSRGPLPAVTLTVLSYLEGDPVHSNGNPFKIIRTTLRGVAVVQPHLN